MNEVSIPGSEEFEVLSPSCIEIVQCSSVVLQSCSPPCNYFNIPLVLRSLTKRCIRATYLMTHLGSPEVRKFVRVHFVNRGAERARSSFAALWSWSGRRRMQDRV
ncbi:hypothetical protein AVEN_225136-1 [Araneus ventricosus]|uniref:DUF4817 domain-containing protein n=1 Tax=Araneus ventricosus TaxID=182803 RepID=A0A4Y2TCQ9_ARAVE|nr:hypothetical protein AVEN_225136-1 [Araneus ventricosus]